MFKDCNGKQLKVGDPVIIIHSNLTSLLGKSSTITSLLRQKKLKPYGGDSYKMFGNVARVDFAYKNCEVWYYCDALMKISPDDDIKKERNETKRIRKKDTTY